MNTKIETIREGLSPGRRSSLAITQINLRDAFAVWRRDVEVHLRLWKMNLIAPAIEPVFSVLAFGWGLGALVAGKVSGISYLSFVGAGILGLTVLMRAMFETTYAAYFRMVYQSTYDAILATPVDAESLAFAEILWAITHAALDTVIILIVLVIFGAATSPWAALAALPLLVGSVFIAGLSLGFTAHVHDIDAFNIYMAAFFTVMLICGAWFPVDVLPVWLRWIAYAIPLTESIDLTRALLTGRFLSRHVYEAAYLVISAIVACEWAMRSLRKRMVA
ncbi:MAG TPA: ABC transporter permease [Pyrinomonadaceae bacterium]|nr:ABC transporter permease [Pyrinomonadaceae bacterium]